MENLEKKLIEIDNKIQVENTKMSDQQRYIKDINNESWYNGEYNEHGND